MGLLTISGTSTPPLRKLDTSKHSIIVMTKMAISLEAFSKMRPATMLLLIAIDTSSLTNISIMMEYLNSIHTQLAQLSTVDLYLHPARPCIPAVMDSPVL
jgi:hypothetical protein